MTTTYTAPVLADLESRAGASDRDREAWLAERRSGVTATEVRDLAIGKIRQQDLIDLKLGRKSDDFPGNPYTEWGKQRESVIAAALTGEGFVEETRVFHHPENSRYLASPDGLRVDFDERLDVLEIKTSKIDLPPGSDEEKQKGYALQVQWVMFVTGARRGRFVVEERLGAPWNFEPGDLHRHWIERDEQVISALRGIADAFLAELDKQREEGAPGVDARAVSLLEADIAASAAAKKARAELEEHVRSTGLSSLKTDAGSLSYSTPAPRKTFDQAAFKTAHPALFAEFQKTTAASKPTLRVTPAKEKAA